MQWHWVAKIEFKCRNYLQYHLDPETEITLGIHLELRSLFLFQRYVWVTSLPLQSPQMEAGTADAEAYV